MKNRLIKSFLFLILISGMLAPASYAIFDDKDKDALKADLKVALAENEKLKTENAEVKTDRDNVLKQAKSFLAEKDAISTKLREAQGASTQNTDVMDSLRKEVEILKSEAAKERNELEKERSLHQEEIQAREKAAADLEAKNNSLAKTLEAYTPEKIEQLTEDRNRLEQENRKMATRVLENEKKLTEMKQEITPFQLDREEMFKLRSENKELQRRIQYVSELEDRQKQLLRENAENREKLEVMKAKFKDAVPGLAKSGRISQKMMRENADMHYNLGTVFLHNKQYKEAIKEYERVLELRPNDSETHYNLGVLYDDYLRDREKALYHYQKYLAINPKSADAKKVETYILSLELEQKVR